MKESELKEVFAVGYTLQIHRLYKGSALNLRRKSKGTVRKEFRGKNCINSMEKYSRSGSAQKGELWRIRPSSMLHVYVPG